MHHYLLDSSLNIYVFTPLVPYSPRGYSLLMIGPVTSAGHNISDDVDGGSVATTIIMITN